MLETLKNGQRRWVKISKRLLIALGMALFLLLLGLYGGLGYSLQSLEEVSRDRSFMSSGFMPVVFYCDITYNPILYPYYWLQGSGHLSGNFSIIYWAEGYSPGERGSPQFGVSPTQRLDFYLTRMLTWGLAINLALLFALATAIEIVQKRILYLVVFISSLGFAFASLAGWIVGLCIGAFSVSYVLIKMPRNNNLEEFWRSLWE